jgi:hypothetical protein
MSDLLARLIAAGTPLDLVGEVAQAIADAAAGARPVSAGAARTRRWRERKASQSVTEASPGDASPTVTNRHQPSHGDAPRVGARAEPKITNSSNPTEKQGKEERGSLRSPRAEEAPADRLLTEFEEIFWPAYPNKVGKPKALSSFRGARRRAGLPDIMAGLQRYVASKPADREWMNPTTFLNQDRWADAPAPPPTPRTSTGPPKKPSIYELNERANAYLRDLPDEPEHPLALPPYRQ